ncbi:LPXTG cell wall anchor domain-containing protein [Plantactinospora endophytica]|uniref:LPXTG cell wall anchor domain-containing protein n=1 Tax=Plantactinospora endophytica TaxID=673535 RepID=UPI001945B10B|nr:LPXTG cell wall anchor domain-containing protein [Plantactinospora endophytica]
MSSTADVRIGPAGTTVGFQLRNAGDAPATGVGAVYDAGTTSDDVILSVPEGSTDCRQVGRTADCRHGELAAGQDLLVYPIVLRSTPDARPGPAGTVRVSVSAQGPDGAVSASYELPVSIRASGSGLVASVGDLGSAQQRVGGGDRRPLDATVFNFGDTALPGFLLNITLPLGATFGERYSDCVYDDDWPGEPPAGYVYGPQRVTCRMNLILEPGAGVAFSDPQSGDAAFNLVFGKNLPGPAEEAGWFEAAELDDQALPDALSRTGTTAGPSLADKIAELRAEAEQRNGTGPPSRAKPRSAGERTPDEPPTTGPPATAGQHDTAGPQNPAGPQATTGGAGPARVDAEAGTNVDEFSIWTKANSHDLEVRATAVTGSVGDTVEVPYTITNHGPSDGAATWRIVAPSGTVLLPSQWCAFRDEAGESIAELSEVDCGTESQWPATASGEGVLSSVVRVKINSTPGTNGTVTVRSVGPSTETGPKSNTAKIVFNEPGGGGGAVDGDDDGLPITGARTGPIAAVGAGVLLLGAVLLLLGRRRRSTVPPPSE